MEAQKFDLAKEGTSVITADGKPLKLEDAIKRLEKKTPILISQGGPPDPYDLQTTKPDTLIIILPLPEPSVPVVPGPMSPKVVPSPLKP